MKNVHIVGTVGLPACYGGFETLVDNIVDSTDIKFTVYCSAKSYNNKDRVKSYKNAELVYLPLNANGIQSIPYDIFSMLNAGIRKADTILILGVSGCIFLPILRKITKARIVTNIDGLEWRRDKWSRGVKSFLKYSEKIAVKNSHVVVSDNQAIADYVQSEYGLKSEVIAYGGDHAVSENIVPQNLEHNNYAFTVCRIEPENNISMILKAFSQIDEHLIIVGNWNNSEYGRNLRNEYSSYSNIKMLDPIYDSKALANYRSGCSYYIHGHSAGGTNPSLVEMMHFGKTILCFDCNYNRATTEDKALYFKDDQSMISIIKSREIHYIDENMLEIAQRRYTWSIVRQQYHNLLK